MSVTRQHFETAPVQPVAPPKPAPTRDKLKLLQPTKEPSAESFWDELNCTLDEFFRVIDASKKHIKELSDKVAERDRRIEMLEATNAALAEQLELGQTARIEPKAAPSCAPLATEPRGEDRRGIWSKLSRLERDAGARFEGD